MSKVKPKKQSTFIDMTAMSDVTVLLLTFFMLTATFLPKEPVQVTAPGSVMDFKIPDANLMTILIKPDGNTYLFLSDNQKPLKRAVLERIGKDNNVTFSSKQLTSFAEQPAIGVPFATLSKFLDTSLQEQDDYLKTTGLATDSTNNQLKAWLQYIDAVSREKEVSLDIAIKADQTTSYPKVNKVISTLQDLKMNRFNLITTLEKMPSGF